MARTKQTARKMPQQYPRAVFAPSTSGASTSRASDPLQETGESRYSRDTEEETGMYIFLQFRIPIWYCCCKGIESRKYEI